MSVPISVRRGLCAAPIVLAGCSGPLSTLAPSGPAARDIATLWWGMLIGSVVLTLMVVILLVMAFRQKREVEARFWTIGMGVWFSLGVLSAVLAAGLWVGERIIPRDDEAVTVEAHAYQWGWVFRHTGADGAEVETDGRLHIPAGQPVDVLITSEDVIHSFWVPQLAGKLDAIPGRVNRARIKADTAGAYEGLCAEFCGVGHAHMRFTLEAHDSWPPDLSDEAEAP